MGTGYSDHYNWHGWNTGEDCYPPEPGKEWLTITEYGEEYAVIVLRTDAFAGDPAALDQAREVREMRAKRIVRALNELH